MPRDAERSGLRMAVITACALLAAPASAAPPSLPPRTDPPARVARLSRADGAVFFHPADADRWSAALRNEPVSAGGAVWTEAGARADLQLAASRIALAPRTELDVSGLDDQALALSAPQGEAYLSVRALQPGDSYTVQTPRGTVQITATGRYGVQAGDADHPTVVTVIDGAAQVTGLNLSLQVGPRQSATITGSDTLQGSVGPEMQDPFLTAMLAEERPARRTAVAVPPVVQQMTGTQDLDEVGDWVETPEYGAVWYPPVEPGWVPYRAGRWSYVAPWGWTWVDDAAWGFAPFHYGRWVQMRDRWGWVPVSPGAAPPRPMAVYAPALVSFVQLGGAALAGGAAGFAAGRPVGWVPLGPREPYYPPYRADLAYVRTLNATSVQNVSQTINAVTVVDNRTVATLANRGGATVVPAEAMLRSAPVGAVARPLPAEQAGQMRVAFRAPLVPAAATAGVTPNVARRLNFVPSPRPQPAASSPVLPPLARVAAIPWATFAVPTGVVSGSPPSSAGLQQARPVPPPMAVDQGLRRQAEPPVIAVRPTRPLPPPLAALPRPQPRPTPGPPQPMPPVIRPPAPPRIPAPIPQAVPRPQLPPRAEFHPAPPRPVQMPRPAPAQGPARERPGQRP